MQKLVDSKIVTLVNMDEAVSDLVKPKLVVAMLAGNCENTIDIALESVKNADEIIIVYDSTSSDRTAEKIRKTRGKIQILERPYDHSFENKIANSQARNFYLEYLKSNYMNDFCLVIDADECVDDFDKLKAWVNKYKQVFDSYPCCSVKMRHFIGDLGHEDATAPEHFCLHRLFKIVPELYYPEGEHPVLNCAEKESSRYACREVVVWHMGYIPNINYYKSRYETHKAKSEIHTKEYLKNWFYQHLFGAYPKSEVNPIDIPAIILNKFGINKDEFYFSNRGIELKHPLMVKQWNDYFKPNSVLDLGCGRGPYLYFWKWYAMNCKGVELSQWAVNNAFVNGIQQGDIIDEWVYIIDNEIPESNVWDLITCIDVLEHLSDDQLDKALKNITKYGKQFLISVPVAEDLETGEQADPNLANDRTHLQFRSRTEWKKLFESYGIILKETPKDWLFANQLFVGERR